MKGTSQKVRRSKCRQGRVIHGERGPYEVDPLGNPLTHVERGTGVLNNSSIFFCVLCSLSMISDEITQHSIRDSHKASVILSPRVITCHTIGNHVMQQIQDLFCLGLVGDPSKTDGSM